MTSTTKIKKRMLAARRYADHYPAASTGRRARGRYLTDREVLRRRRMNFWTREFARGFRQAGLAFKRMVQKLREATQRMHVARSLTLVKESS